MNNNIYLNEEFNIFWIFENHKNLYLNNEKFVLKAFKSFGLEKRTKKLELKFNRLLFALAFAIIILAIVIMRAKCFQ